MRKGLVSEFSSVLALYISTELPCDWADYVTRSRRKEFVRSHYVA